MNMRLLLAHFDNTAATTWPILDDFSREKEKAMKKKAAVEHKSDEQEQVEIVKAVAQAWHSHSGSCRPMNEFDAHRRNFKGTQTSRFKLEAMGKRAADEKNGPCGNWDFRQSLWDSYEIVTVSKRLEASLVFDDNVPFTEVDNNGHVRVHSKRKESKNSLRNLFNRISSRRFNEAVIQRLTQS